MGDNPDETDQRSAATALCIVSLLLPLLPFALGAVVRTATGLPFPLSATAGVLLAAGVVAGSVLTWGGARPRRFMLVQSFCVLAVLVGGSIWVLWPRLLDGLITVGGWDSGNHLYLRRSFLEYDPAAYYKFVTYYGVTAGFEWLLGLDAFESMRLGFYAIPFAFIVCLLASHVAAADHDRDTVASVRVGHLVLGALFVAAALICLLPLLHYHQADGFYVHLFGLIPLMAGATLYGLVRGRITRVALLLVWCVLQRFTYGLNLGDCAATAGIMLAVEGCQLRGPRIGRWALFGVASVMLVAAILVYKTLAPLVREGGGGGITRPGMRYTLVGELLLTALLLSLPIVAQRVGPGLGDVASRLARFAATFGALNLVVHGLVVVLPHPDEYYFLKYHVYGLVLTLGISLVVTAVLVGRALAGDPIWRRHPLPLIAVGVLGLALFCIGLGYRPYEASFRERLRGQPPWRIIMPQADRRGWDHIQAALTAERCTFGGILAPSFTLRSSDSLMHFTNAALGLPGQWMDSIQRVKRGVIIEKIGACIFWYGDDTALDELDRYQRRYGGQIGDAARALNALPDKRCDEYITRWGAPARLCHVLGRSLPATMEYRR
jgi:hypothetical protein